MNRSDIEQALCGIWEELLDTEVTPEDDFFELGGYSLLLVTVIAEARKAGITMTADDVFDHKTPSAIAAALLPAEPAGIVTEPTGAARGGDPDFNDIWATGLSPLDVKPRSTLTPLTDGGEGTPVFCFHWGAGNVGFVGEFVDSFRGGRPVYGLESVGLWNRERPPLSLVEMATRYLRDIRTVQPHGPYLLLGPCAGGRLAFEVARQLEQAGEQVAVLALANSMPPEATELDPSWGLREFYNFRLASLRRQFGVDSLSADPGRVIEAMIKTGKIEPQTNPADLHWLQAVWAAGNFAQEHYEARPYGGELTVFQLSVNADREDADWGRVAAVAETHTFEAEDTLPLLREPTFAELLRKRLAAFKG
jgi:thioesterase domain-containing protein